MQDEVLQKTIFESQLFNPLILCGKETIEDSLRLNERYTVEVTYDREDTDAVEEMANLSESLELPISFSITACSISENIDTQRFRLRVSSYPLRKPYKVCCESGVCISSHRSVEICRFIEMDIGKYFLLLALSGLSQLSVISRNKAFIPEDFVHPSDALCIYAEPKFLGEHVIFLEHPNICQGCERFYARLGATMELTAIRKLLVCHTSRS